MSKRGVLTRQQSLGVQEDAIKIIEKYCRKKYRHSTLFVGASLPPDLESTSATPEPFREEPTDHTEAPTPMSAMPFGNRMSYFPSQYSIDNRLSNIMSSQNITESRSPTAPFPVVDYFHTPIKEEIKPRPTETILNYLWRLILFLYEHCGLKDILLVLLIVMYSLLGGLVFYHLEAPEAELQLQRQRNNTYERQLNFTKQITRTMLSSECRKFTASTEAWHMHESEWINEDAFDNCIIRIRSIINLYDHVAGYDPLKKTVWKWDYWNAVFYAWTLLTTIGYGNLSCHTKWGRAVTIGYALLGLPLMLIVLNILGKRLFLLLQSIWQSIRRKVKRRTKRLYRYATNHGMEKLMNSEKVMDKSSKEQLTEHVVEEAMMLSDDLDIFETFPLKLALVIVFVYIGLCSVIFRYWESDWDFFTAFYFFFISLSTIGLGDEMPQHPHYAVGFFIFFVIGLSLVSMCFSILQSRIENKYMAAFQMIDEENSKFAFPPTLASVEDLTSNSNKNEPVTIANYVARPGSILLNSNVRQTVDTDGNIKWRQNGLPMTQEEFVMPNGRRISLITSQTSEETNRPFNRMMSGSSMSSLASTPVFSPTPPVLGAFIARKQSMKRNRVYPPQSDSWTDTDTNSPTSQARKRNQSEGSYNISPGSELGKSDWAPSMPPETGASANVVHTGLRSSLFTIPLSVITESEEDQESKETSRSSQKKRPPPLKLVKAIEEDFSDEESTTCLNDSQNSHG